MKLLHSQVVRQCALTALCASSNLAGAANEIKPYIKGFSYKRKSKYRTYF